jgi:hypothetical protein
MSTDNSMINAIEKILSTTPKCLCGTFESCDLCDQYSALNRMRKEVLEAIRGTGAPKTAADYGKIYLL